MDGVRSDHVGFGVIHLLSHQSIGFVAERKA